MNDAAQFFVNGIAVGGIYALVGVGVTLVYGLTRLVNFAHGEQVTLGGFICFAVIEGGGPFSIGLLAGGLASAMAGLIMERGAFRYTRPKPINGILVSIGLTLVFQGLFFQVFGDRVLAIAQPFPGQWRFLGAIITQQRLVVTAAAAAVVAILFLYLKRSRMGLAIRSYAQDPEATELMGVSSDRVVVLVFVVGGLLAGLAGGLLLSLVPVSRFIGATFAVKGFMVAIVGGLGNPRGALLAGLVIGVAESLAGGYIGGGVAAVSGLVAAIVVLMLRPQGLLRGEEGAEL